MTAIYGVDVVDPNKLRHPFSGLTDTPDDWRGIFNGSLDESPSGVSIHAPA
jgi:hypothetical protein